MISQQRCTQVILFELVKPSTAISVTLQVIDSSHRVFSVRETHLEFCQVRLFWKVQTRVLTINVFEDELKVKCAERI